MDQVLKDKISKTRNETRERRSHLVCKTCICKIDGSRLNKKQKEALSMLFVEAKWFYNYLVGVGDEIFKADCKIKEIPVKNKRGELEQRMIKFLGTVYKQKIIKSVKQSIYALARSKKCGHRVGRLRFKKEFNTLNLVFTEKGGPCGNGYYVDNNKIKILGIKKLMVVNGLTQLPKNCEFGEAKLIKKPSGFYVHIAIYSKPMVGERGEIKEKLKEVGLDFGVKEMITTSDGEIFSHISVQEPEHLKRLQQKLMRSKKGSKNRYKTRLQIQREYEKMSNQKEDISNKIVYKLFSQYETIYIQDDNVGGWIKRKRHWSERIHHSCLGRIKEKLISKGAIVVNRYLPTTQLCYRCGHKTKLTLGERVFKCENCDFTEPRDIKAAKTILMFGNGSLKMFEPMERRCQPVETKTSTLKGKKLLGQVWSKKQEDFSQKGKD